MTRATFNRRSLALSAGVLLCAVALRADDHIVEFDKDVNLGTARTFAMEAGTVDSSRPELDNALILKNVADAIRGELTSRGLKETADHPELVVEYSLTTTAYTIGTAGRARVIPDSGRQGPPNAGVEPMRFLEGVLVVDLATRSNGLLVWRGVFRASENTAARLGMKLPDEIRTLFEDYPR